MSRREKETETKKKGRKLKAFGIAVANYFSYYSWRNILVY